MTTAVPEDDLPESLNGAAVPADDLPDSIASKHLTPQQIEKSVKKPKESTAMDWLKGAGEVAAGMGAAALAGPVMAGGRAIQTLGKGLGYGAAALAGGTPVGEAIDTALQEGATKIRADQERLARAIPQNEEAQAIGGAIGKPFEMASGALGTVGEAAGGLVGPKTAAAGHVLGENAIDIAGSLMGAGGLAKGLKAARAMKPEMTWKQQNIERAMENGYKANPMDSAGGVQNSVLGTIANPRALDEELTNANAKNSTRLAKKSVGIPEGQPLNEANLDKIKADANAKYNAIQQITDVDFERPELMQRLAEDLDKANKPSAGVTRAHEAAPEYYRDPAFQRLKAEVLNPQKSHTAASLMAMISDLRADASKMAKAQTSKQEDLRKVAAMRNVANALEDHLERGLLDRSVYTGGEAMAMPRPAPAGAPLPSPGAARPLPGPAGEPPSMPPKFGGTLQGQDVTGRQKLIDDWRKARETLAKIHNIEESTNLKTEHVDPAKLKKSGESGGRLTGELADIVHAHETMGHVVRGTEGKTANTGVRAGDYGTAEALIHATTSVTGVPLALRKTMASDLYQKHMAHPTVTSLQQLKELDPKLAAKAVAALAAAKATPNRNALPPRIELSNMAPDQP